LPTIVTSNGTAHKRFDENDEEVRSKPRRCVSNSVASVSTSGVKTIADILNSADEQLKLSQEFADKLAIRRSVAHYRVFVNIVACVGFSYTRVCIINR
jgi:GTP-sensing pleiotropic transcriptional regulator CodY